jgi:hypothetical protein
MSIKQKEISLENLKLNSKQMDILRNLELYLGLEAEKIKSKKK